MEEVRYLYNIGYDTYEESDHRQFWHTEKFTAEQIEEIIAEVLIPLLKGSKLEEWESSFQDFFYLLVEGLEKRGFVPVKFEADVSYFGWSGLLRNNWEGQDDETNIRLRERISKEPDIDRH